MTAVTLSEAAGPERGDGKGPSFHLGECMHSRVLQSPLACAREGVMLHYDDSSRDEWALEWFRDPRCTNGYTWLVLDDGRVVELADPRMRTPHAGACRREGANSAFYGVSVATNGLVLATEAQRRSVIALCVVLMRHHGWGADGGGPVRIVGHDEQAIWTPQTTRAAGMLDATGRALWGRLGRKVDPTGVRKDRRPIIDINEVRRRVAAALLPASTRSRQAKGLEER